VPATGGDTLWASTYRAYETLSPPIQELISGLSALHSSARYYTRRYGSAAATGKSYPEAVHPVVTTHPITGRRALYVNTMFTASIPGLSPAESDALLKMLFDHVAYGVGSQVRVRLEVGSVAMWDNRCTQHHVLNDFAGVRVIQRVTVMGDEPEPVVPSPWPPYGSKTATFWRDTPMRKQLKAQRD
jgi:taurine dioxygenase